MSGVSFYYDLRPQETYSDLRADPPYVYSVYAGVAEEDGKTFHLIVGQCYKCRVNIHLLTEINEHFSYIQYGKP